MSRVTRSKANNVNASAVGRAAQEGADEGRPLSGSAAALLQVLSLPALEQHLQPSRGRGAQHKVAAAARDVAALGTVLGRPGDPGVQQFLGRCWEALEEPAAAVAAGSWSAALPHTLHGYDYDDLESSKLPELKALCRALDLPLSGKKADFLERLQDVLPLLPQRVPLAVALVAQPKLAKIVQVQEELALLAAQDGGGKDSKTLSAYTAKKLYLLSDSDLRGIRNASTYPYRYCYLESDVKRAALLKHGSLAGVEEAVERSGQKALDKRQKTVDQRAARQLEANAALEARGLSRLKKSSDIKCYIAYGRPSLSYGGDLETCITRALEAEQRDLANKAAQAERDARRAELLARLTELGLQANINVSASCRNFISQGGCLQGAVDGCAAMEQRRLELLARLMELGLEGSMGLNVCESYVHGGGLLQGAVDACVEREQRRQELLNALAALGLELDPHEYSCDHYIRSGVGQVAQIVAKLDETNFFNMHTISFETDYQEIREATARMEDYPPHYGFPGQHKVYLSHAELVLRARAAALAKWAAQTHASLEACLADPRLPPSLHQAVRDSWVDPVEQQQQQQQQQQQAQS